ncbi:hypothetical protein [Rhizobium leguminosarum]|uniref:Uncharacterized protein n=1 Tax=Rhizobium leguminosarum TaxID=384 RepID=A0A6P0B248_RHILE|nr:hypothetical protein [Rhizobium leguminosarum]MBY5436735.1 hypothetical protein [Rhizobium leguminosarum]NEI33970.1 hypothetical protein [Rhizobium leguminosarum]NEI40333.1 hypothetical protein [Rhizobium leguminosarum]
MSANAVSAGDVPGGPGNDISAPEPYGTTGKSSDLPVVPLSALVFLLLSPAAKELQPHRAEALNP